MNAQVHQIIHQKREWHYQPGREDRARGFRGWHSRGFLPHFDAPDIRQMITYRLADAMPVTRRREWAALLAMEDEREKRIQIEKYLDRGFGESYLRESAIAKMVQDNLLRLDGHAYRLLAWCIMPNHVHVLIEIRGVPLARILKTWKWYTAQQANLILRRSGRFWAPDYFDRYIRDAEHFRKAVRYIENNPVKAGLVREPQNWTWSSASHRTPQTDWSAESLSACAVPSNAHMRGQAVRAPIQMR